MKLLYRNCFTYGLLLFSFFAYAKKVEIIIYDEADFPVESAFINVYAIDDTISPKQSYITDENGTVTFEIENTSVITIRSIGYKNITDTITTDDHSKSRRKYVLKEKVIVLEEVVLTAQIDETNPENAVQVIKIIDKEQIFAQGAVTLKDVLATQQNVRLSQDLILGSSMSLMGVSGQNVKILVDGVPVIGRLSGDIDLSQINLSNVERIEIIEGPLSVNYGSDALAGTINIITKNKQKEKLKIGANAFYETIGQYNFSVNGGIHFKKSCLKLEGGRNFFQGYAYVDTSRYKDWKPKEQYFASLNYAYYLPKADLRFKSEIFDEYLLNRGYPRSPFYISAFDDTYKTQRINNTLFYEQPVGNHANIDLKAGYNYYNRKKNTYITDLTTLEQTLSEEESSQDTSGFDLWMSRGTYNHSNDSTNIKYQIGYDFNRESAIGKRISDGHQQIFDLGLFSSLEWSIFKSLIIKPGVRVSHNSAYKAPPIPSLHFKWSKENWTARASYARGFRAPSIKDLYFDFVDVNHNIQGNPDLEAEYSNNYQAHISRKLSLKGKRSFDFKLGGFYNDIDNLITLTQLPNSAEFSYQNVEEFKTVGLQNTNSFKSKNTGVTLGFSYIGRYNNLSEDQNVATYSYYPELLTTINHTFKKPKLKMSVFAKYQGKYPGFFMDENDNVVDSYIEPFTYVDMSLSRKFKESLRIAVGVKNLLSITTVNSSAQTGTHSSSTTSTPVSYGRTYFITINYEFKKNEN